MTLVRIASTDFLPLAWGESDTSCEMEVRYDLCSGRGDIWGGVALAAGINALSAHVDKMPVLFASAQFHANKSDAERLILNCELISKRRTIAQGLVKGCLDDVDFLRLSACFGERASPHTATCIVPAVVPTPEDCDEVDLGNPRVAMHSHTELRLAHGMFGVTGQGSPSNQGLLTMWARMPKAANDVGGLVILADYMLSGIGNSLGKIAYGVSLDNSVRIAKLVPTDWVQCDITMCHIEDGFGYGIAHLFSEDGVLMATASQSVVVRVPDEST